VEGDAERSCGYAESSWQIAGESVGRSGEDGLTLNPTRDWEPESPDAFWTHDYACAVPQSKGVRQHLRATG